MLQVVLFHCLQFLYVLLDFFRSVLEGYQLKRFRHIFRRKKRGNKTNFHVPKHFAVLFTEAHLIHWTWIADLIRHASVNGVERLTFYDPWSILTTREKQLRTYLCKEFPEKRKTRSLLFDDEAAPPFSKGAIVVEVIDARSGKDALIHTCKQVMFLLTTALLMAKSREVDFAVSYQTTIADEHHVRQTGSLIKRQYFDAFFLDYVF
jgi:hypothetical protein